MFIRENQNRSGSVSIQVVEKINGNNKVIFSAGAASHPSEIELLKVKARQFIDSKRGVLPLFVEKDDIIIQAFVESLNNDCLRIVGPQMVLEPLFNRVFSPIQIPYFQELVLCRIIYPGSKLRTVTYLSQHFNTTVSQQTIYRAMDELDESVKNSVEKCTYQRVKEYCQDGQLNLVFYDMTSLYFETESEDDLRRLGYSKDGKHQNPQVMVGLVVNSQGYPIAFDIFEGNKSETKTLIPILERLASRFSLAKPIIVADAALLSKKNLQALQGHDYTYILGGRIKNESEQLKAQITGLTIVEGAPIEISHPYGRLVVSYSKKRSAKDAHNREKGIKRLEKKVKTGKLTKEAINNKGYNKYLKMQGDTEISIDYQLVDKDRIWDGLKGYVTNTNLTKGQVIAKYSNLWQVEKAFRMSKTDLRFRPIFHRKQRRIKSHLLICFAAYAIYKELEIKIKANEVEISVQKAIEELKNVQEITYTLPRSKQTKNHILKTNDLQKKLLNLKN